MGLAADLVCIDHDRREFEAGELAGDEEGGRPRLNFLPPITDLRRGLPTLLGSLWAGR